ncbi:sodium:solute symporter family domain-containing protein, putative [Eimeria necatrix]|uniref:Sodium:solute symporter family domain-containing protein, putative n=1 Tax=Eimeria necatrix TaxID=51315 RepID=U6MKS4_9EIME|nr:sodium:solute symporter family domain-containing protein, putative [Eimeria necatrix]CDJ64857.1 sodium:solute symporter family domain-containing protein, putative [Eimeria necatrix]
MGALSLNWAYGVFLTTVFGFGLFVLYGARRQSLGRLLSPGPSFLSARQEVTWVPLGLSLYASFMGNWVLYLPPVAGALYGWPGVIGYALSSSLPYLLLLWLSSRIYSSSKGAFCSCDFLAERFGLPSQVAAALVSLSMMFVSLSSELTTVGLSMKALTRGAFPLPCAVILVAVIPLLYVLLGGLKCCIISDVVQAVVIVFLFIPFVVFLICKGGPGGPWAPPTLEGLEIEAVSFTPSECAVAGAVLVLSVWPVFLCDQGIWQRVWAARSVGDMQRGFVLAAVLVGGSVLLFGTAGLVCLTREEALMGASLFTFAAERLPVEWVVMLCVLAVACVTSSVDTYQAAIVSLIGKDLEKFHLSFNWARLAMVVVNVPAVLLALYQVSLLALYMVSNFLCAVLAGPFVVTVHPSITALGFLGGLGCAAVALSLCGVVAALVSGIPFSFAFFAPEDISSVPYLVSFIVVPVVGAVAAAAISALDRHCNQTKTTTPPSATAKSPEGQTAPQSAGSEASQQQPRAASSNSTRSSNNDGCTDTPQSHAVELGAVKSSTPGTEASCCV